MPKIEGEDICINGLMRYRYTPRAVIVDHLCSDQKTDVAADFAADLFKPASMQQ